VNEEIKNLSYISHLSRDWSRWRPGPRKIPVMNARKSGRTCTRNTDTCIHIYVHTHTHTYVYTRIEEFLRE